MKNQNITFRTILVGLALLCAAAAPKAFGVVPAPDGGYPGGNTAEGQNALLSLNVNAGINNTAVGFFSLKSNVEGQFNTAVGAGTLFSNTAHGNTAIGGAALFSNTTATYNTAVGLLALFSHTGGGFNTAIGHNALLSNTGSFGNTAVGASALQNATSGGNTAIGRSAGRDIIGFGNVCIGEGVFGNAGDNDTTRIRNVYSSTATARVVYVNSDNKIGTLSSTRRVKEDIRPMNGASEAVRALKPVTFRYKKEIDPTRSPQFGLIAEQVAEVDPALVTRNTEGKPETVRYEAVNAMLLNEFLKEHRKVEEQQATIAELKKAIAHLAARDKEQDAKIQKVSAQIEMSRPARQLASNDD
jgi:Chaperone of endosialidase